MKRINITLAFTLFSIIMVVPDMLRSQALRSQSTQSRSVIPATNYSSPQITEQQQSAPNVIQVEPCSGESPSNPYRTGMFQYEGDFERFVTATHNDNKTCVTTWFNTTHEVATLQDNNCLATVWKVSHGTPEVCVDGTYPNHFIHLWSGNWTTDATTEGEGIFYDCPLNPCKYYDISVKLSATRPVKKVFFYLGKDLQHRATPIFNGEDPMYKVPNVPTKQLVHTLNNFSTGYSAPNGGIIWVKINIPVFRPIGPDMKLWIYTEDDKSNLENVAQSGGPDLLLIDEVTDGIEGSNGTCSGSVTYTTSIIPPITTKQTIYASGAAQVNVGQNVEFDAGTVVLLLAGFKALQGSNFRAHIVPCVNSAYCPPTGTTPPAAMANNTEESALATVHPNPASDFFYIEKSGGDVLSVKLIDEASNIELGFTQYSDLGDKIRVGIDHLKTGSYILVVKSSKRTYTKHLKIIR